MQQRLSLVRSQPDMLLERLAELSTSQRALRRVLPAALLLHIIAIDSLPHAPAAPLLSRQPAITELFALEPEPPPKPEPKPSEPEPSTLARTHTVTPQRPTAPAPAAAAAALTRDDDDSSPVDFTDAIVVGNATQYAGGITAANGTNSNRRGTAPAGSALIPTATKVAPASGPDRSHPPGMLGGLAWNCPFPANADIDGVDHATVAIRVDIDAGGRATKVSILSDPGHGFAEAARRCAFEKRWSAAADSEGRAMAAGINLNVRFFR